MPAPPKVSVQQITNALLKWGGNVTAAAEDLGVRRNNLAERIERLGLNLDGFRKGGIGITPFTSNAPFAAPPLKTPPRSISLARESSGVPVRDRGSRRNVAPMSSTAMAVSEPTARRRPTPRLRPDHLDKLTEAKYDLQALLRRDVSESQILEEFIEERLAPWLRDKLEALKKSRKAGGGGER